MIVSIADPGKYRREARYDRVGIERVVVVPEVCPYRNRLNGSQISSRTGVAGQIDGFNRGITRAECR